MTSSSPTGAMTPVLTDRVREVGPGTGCILELRGRARRFRSLLASSLTWGTTLVLSLSPFLPTLLLKKMFQRFCQ